jgi:hypothetical protein
VDVVFALDQVLLRALQIQFVAVEEVARRRNRVILLSLVLLLLLEA